jgi:subtilisin-like proprotein convertase family protein
LRTFIITDEFTIADLDVGFNMKHEFRNDAIAWLESPAGTRVELLSKGSNNANLDVLFNDAASTSIFLDYDLEDHDIGLPYYDNVRKPYAGHLYQFRGESAKGTWTLQLCDNYPQDDDGLYYHSQLIMRSDKIQAETQASWQYQLALPDDVEQMQKSLTIYGYDSVGNRSEPINVSFEIDTKRPVISVTTAAPFSDTNITGREADAQESTYKKRGIVPTDLQASQVITTFTLSGTVTDAYTPTLRLRIQTPNGNFKSDRIDIVGDTWIYTDTTRFNRNGTYCLWVEAEDKADNQTVDGPLALQATVVLSGTTAGGGQIYLPVIMGGQASSGTPDDSPDNGDTGGNRQGGPNMVYLPLIARNGSGEPIPGGNGAGSSVSGTSVTLQFVDPVACR